LPELRVLDEFGVRWYVQPLVRHFISVEKVNQMALYMPILIIYPAQIFLCSVEYSLFKRCKALQWIVIVCEAYEMSY